MNAEGGGDAPSASSSSSQQQQQVVANERSVQPAMHLTSDEINYLIYRYMQESGFVHSSFSFIYESMLGRSNMKSAERSIPPGALVSFLQKGLQYIGIEETLQREQQRVNVSNSNSNKRKGGNSNNSMNNGSNINVSSMAGGSSTADGVLNLSLLSPTTIGAMTRENPPLQLNVPPATAAAAIRARLEAEAQIEADRKKIAMEAHEKATLEQSNGSASDRMNGPSSIPPQPSLHMTNPLVVSAASIEMQQAAHASVVNQMQQHDNNYHHASQNSSLTQQQQHVQTQQQNTAVGAGSAGAAALLAQQRRAVAEIAVIEEQRQARAQAQIVQQQLQMQLQQEQEKFHMQKLHQESLNAAAQAQAHNLAVAASDKNPIETMSGINTAQVAATLASVAEHMGNNVNDQNNNNSTINDVHMNESDNNSNKRPTSSKKGPKNKGKQSSKQQRIAIGSQQEALSATTPQGETHNNSSANMSLTAPQNIGFASLLEAASTDGDASGGASLQNQQQRQRQKQTDAPSSNDAPNLSVEDKDLQSHHRHLQHHPQTSNLFNQTQNQVISSGGELPSQQASAVQDLMTMNGKHMGERHFNGGTEQQIPNGSIASAQSGLVSSSSLVQHQPVVSTVTAGTQIAPKEAAKAIDAVIEKEDELTNANLSEVLELKMHQSEVFMCAWNSVFTNTIATGSGDASARIWQMGGQKASNGLGPVKLLPHGTGPRDKKNKDVTTLEWSSDGKLLATGSYDGVARVWSLNGALVHTLRGHKGPIFSLKWNKKGNYLLSGSYDKTTIVWDVSNGSGFIKQQFEDHQAPALDVDWKDDTTFASCSTDKTVHICRVGLERPLKTYTGHTDEVNAVKWDPSGTLLASCSDDCTAKVWDVNSDRTDPMYDFKSHQQEIYTVKWAPTGPGSKNPDKKPMLATASFDGSVRLWSVQDGTCIQVFSRHRDSVYSVAFSPSGSYLASGSLAGQLYIWNVMEGRHIKSFKGKGDIFEVAWNKEETRVAACFS